MTGCCQCDLRSIGTVTQTRSEAPVCREGYAHAYLLPYFLPLGIKQCSIVNTTTLATGSEHSTELSNCGEYRLAVVTQVAGAKAN